MCFGSIFPDQKQFKSVEMCPRLDCPIKHYQFIQILRMQKDSKDSSPEPIIKTETPSSKSVRKYDRISYNTRVELIEKVINEKVPVLQAAKMLDIKLSTAKYIIKSFQNNRHIFMKKSEVGEVERNQALERHHINLHRPPNPQKPPENTPIIFLPTTVYVTYPIQFPVIHHPFGL